MTKKQFCKLPIGEIAELCNREFSTDSFLFSPKEIKKKLDEDWDWDYNKIYEAEAKGRLYDILIKHRPELFI